MTKSDDTHKLVQDAYASVARKQSSCCGPQVLSCGGNGKPYTVSDHPVPEAELGLSCGNPVAFSQLKEGDVVLDLGSGAGKDVFLAAQKVGHSGKVIGVDMTGEMISLARSNAVKFLAATGLANVEFRQGFIEHLPIEDNSVDVVISNCVINLSPDKEQVFREVHRVLKLGGKMVVSDIVLNRELPEQVRKSASSYAACIAGALLREQYLQAVRQAGFTRVEVLADKTYQASGTGSDPITKDVADELANIASSITVLAVK